MLNQLKNKLLLAMKNIKNLLVTLSWVLLFTTNHAFSQKGHGKGHGGKGGNDIIRRAVGKT